MTLPAGTVQSDVGTPVVEQDKKLSLVDQMQQIPKFSGNNPYYTLKTFKKEFNEWSRFFNWREQDKFFILTKRLEGKAHEIIEVHEDNISTCEEIFERLHERLSTSVTPKERLEELWAFAQTPEMPVADFISLARKKAVAAAQAHECTKNNVDKATEEWLLSSLCKNILPQYRKEILRKKPKTSKEFEEIALNEESVWKATNGISVGPSVQCNALVNNGGDKMMRMLEEMNSHIRDLTLKVDKLEKEKSETKPKQELQDITCLHCGRKGHVKSDCWFLNQNQGNFNSRGRGGINHFRGAHNFQNQNFRGSQRYQGNFREEQHTQGNNRNFTSRGNNNYRGNNYRGNNNFRGNNRGRGFSNNQNLN